MPEPPHFFRIEHPPRFPTGARVSRDSQAYGPGRRHLPAARQGHGGFRPPPPMHAFYLLLDLFKHSYRGVDENLETFGVGGFYINSLVLELIRLRLDKDNANPEEDFLGGDNGFTTALQAYAQGAGGRVAALDARLKGRQGAVRREDPGEREGQVPCGRHTHPVRGAAQA